MAVNTKSSCNEYEIEIKKLKEQVKSLEKSKIDLMVNTNKEIDRLREYIKLITNNDCDKDIIFKKTVNGLNDNDSYYNDYPEEIDDKIDDKIDNKIDEMPIMTKTVTQDEIDDTMNLHHDIIVEMESILNEYQTLQLFGVVECKCNEPKQLQFISSIDETDMKCDNCKQTYSSIFKCDICLMSICSKCQTFIAEMQCLRAVMQNFVYAQDYQLQQTELIGLNANTNNINNINDINNNLNINSLMFDNSNVIYDDFFDDPYNNNSNYGNYIFDNFDGNTTRLDGQLYNLIDKLRRGASDKLEDILEEELIHITFEKIESKICYKIVDYLDEIDFCCIISSKDCVKLLEICWQLYQYHITFDCNKWKKLRLLISNKIQIIKDIIANNSTYKGYINDYYIPDINGNELIKPKLLYDINGNPIHNVYNHDIDIDIDQDNNNNNKKNDNNDNENEYHLNYINDELNKGFGNKVIRLLRIIIDKEEYDNIDITFERLKYKKYGENNKLIANGIYYIWHCHGLQTSFALEEQSFDSFLDAMAEEYGDDNPIITNHEHINDDINNDINIDDDESPIGQHRELEPLSSAHVNVQNLCNNNDNDDDNNDDNDDNNNYDNHQYLTFNFDPDEDRGNDITTPLTPMGAPAPNKNNNKSMNWSLANGS